MLTEPSQKWRAYCARGDTWLSGVGFFPNVPRGVIPAKAGIQEKGGQVSRKRLDARLRGHDGLADPDKGETRDKCKWDEKPTPMRAMARS